MIVIAFLIIPLKSVNLKTTGETQVDGIQNTGDILDWIDGLFMLILPTLWYIMQPGLKYKLILIFVNSICLIPFIMRNILESELLKNQGQGTPIYFLILFIVTLLLLDKEPLYMKLNDYKP